MTPEALSTLAVFAVVATVTPGPNNLMLMSSGVNFGLRQTLPHLLGVASGFAVMIAGVGMGVSQVFEWYPPSYDILRVLCGAYLIYLAYKMAFSGGKVTTRKQKTQPMTFFQAAMFQWVNPKGWTMAITATSLYASDHSVAGVLIVAGVFGLMCLPCNSLWVGIGSKLAGYLNQGKRLQVFNISMAALLLGSVLPALL